LIKALRKLKKADGTDVWGSLRAALKTIWHKDKIETLSKQLEDYKRQLGLRLLVLLNAKSDLQSADNVNRLRTLETSNQRIVEIVTFTQSLMEAAFSSSNDNTKGSEYDQTIKRYWRSMQRLEGDPSDKEPQRLCEQAHSAILTFEDGTVRSISDLARPSLQSGRPKRKQNLHRVTTFRDESNSVVDNGISTQEFAFLAKKVLLGLHFRMINVRMDSVADVHKNTFQWIFKETGEARGWDNFIGWLRDGKGCYWINGKAGSGKSTLMKSIVLHKQTKIHLQKWAGDQQLAQTSFFFWSSGTQLQKSQEGLLRGLLTDILKQCPYLIPNVFPDLCREIALGVDSKRTAESDFSIVELKSAFRRLLEYCKGTMKMCLFIDGLDEYNGDHASMCAFLIDITSTPASPVKIVLSSRPWVVLSDSLSLFPGLRLQDLTRPDIELYVSDKLIGNPGMKTLLEWQPNATIHFSNLICERASGVFLWVVLAVRSLLDGLTYGDRMAELHQRLESLPTDLEIFYMQIFETLEPRVQKDAARIFLIMLQSTEVQGDNPIELLQLALADDVKFEDAIRAPMQAMPQNRMDALCEIMRRRIDVRSRGLLEIYGRSSVTVVGSSTVIDYVGFLHRTVADFLRTSEMWELLISLSGTSFDSYMSLISSCLSAIKIMPIERLIMFSTDRVVANMQQALACAKILELQRLRPCTAALDEVERAVNLHWNGAEKYKAMYKDNSWRIPTKNGWQKLATQELPGTRYVFLGTQHEFLRLAIHSGCVLYAADKALNNDNVTEADRQALLLDTIINYFHGPREEKTNHITVIGRYIAQISDINYNMGRGSIWHEFLFHVSLISESSEEGDHFHKSFQRANEILQIFRQLLAAGVHPSAGIQQSNKKKEIIKKSAIQVYNEYENIVVERARLSDTGDQQIDELRLKFAEIRKMFVQDARKRISHTTEKQEDKGQVVIVQQKRRVRRWFCW
jgi:hypothetical protein